MFVAMLLALSTRRYCSHSAVPSGTILPSQLSKTIDSCKAQAGERISARLMQDVRFGPDQRLNPERCSLAESSARRSAHVTLTFDRIVNHHQTIPIRTDLRSTGFHDGGSRRSTSHQ